MSETILLLISGAFGSLAKDCIQDSKIQLPYFKNGYFFVGFIGGMFIGAFVGYVVDGSVITAGLAGYVGTSAIINLLPNSKKTSEGE